MNDELPRQLWAVLLARLLIPVLLTLVLCFSRGGIRSTPTVPHNAAQTTYSTPVPVQKEVCLRSENAPLNQAPIQREEADSLDEIIEQTARRYHVDPVLVKAVIMAESGYNPRAISKKGARGLMQLMPGTAESLGVENIFDPRENIDAGVRYLKLMITRFDGNTELALAAYNAGSRKVRMHRGVPPFQATRDYIAKVFQYYEHFKDNAEREKA